MYNEEAPQRVTNRDRKPDRTLRFLRNLVIALLAVLALLIVEYNNSTSTKTGVKYSHETVDDGQDGWFDESDDDDGSDDDDAMPSGTNAMDKELQKMDPHVH